MRLVRYWLTTHYPRQVDEEHDPPDLYLPEGREHLAEGLQVGDRVLVYETSGGRTVVRGGEAVRPARGRGGIIAIRSVAGPMEAVDDGVVEYADGSIRHWRWRVPLTLLDDSGFVSRVELNELFGYQSGYVWRGVHLVEIGESLFESVRRCFQNNARRAAR